MEKLLRIDCECANKKSLSHKVEGYFVFNQIILFNKNEMTLIIFNYWYKQEFYRL
jgi:hypothetical protein